jgi:hypothetical protein
MATNLNGRLARLERLLPPAGERCPVCGPLHAQAERGLAVGAILHRQGEPEPVRPPCPRCGEPLPYTIIRLVVITSREEAAAAMARGKGER